MSLIYESDHMEVFFEDRGGNVLLITFNEMGMRANGVTFWGAGLARKLNLSIAAFVSREPNWFPRVPFEAAVAALDAAVSSTFAHRVAYGLSQGGYGALAYAKMLKATAILAFSPQASIDPADIADERFNRFFSAPLHTGMLPSRTDWAASSFVIYDPRDRLDAEHIVLLRTRLSFDELPLPFIGHSSSVPFARTETMRALLACTICGDRTGLMAVAAVARRRSVSRPYLICQILQERHARTALRIFEHYRDCTHNPWWLIGRLLAMRGFAREVRQWMLAACGNAPDIAEVWACAAMALVELPDRSAALRCIGRARELDPGNKVWEWVERRAASIPAP